MSRLVKVESGYLERIRLSQAVVIASKELLNQSLQSELTRDLAAFISLTLTSLYESVNRSVNAWEKRGYWLKADRFRLQWEWTDRLSREMMEALKRDDWASMASISAEVLEKLKDIKIPKRGKFGTPWSGARMKVRI